MVGRMVCPWNDGVRKELESDGMMKENEKGQTACSSVSE